MRQLCKDQKINSFRNFEKLFLHGNKDENSGEGY